MQKYFSVLISSNVFSRLGGAFFLCLLFSFSSTAQASDILEGFTLTQNGNTVLVNFSIRGGASCNGVTLERRKSEDISYITAGAIQGVCGGSEFIEHYVIVDELPELGATNIYRLLLGTEGVSEEKKITVIELLTEYTIYPQPAASEVFLKYNNPNNEPVSVKVYDGSGRIVKRLFGLTSDIIFINSSDLEIGLYIFQLEFNSGAMLTGKFIRSES